MQVFSLVYPLPKVGVEYIETISVHQLTDGGGSLLSFLILSRVTDRETGELGDFRVEGQGWIKDEVIAQAVRIADHRTGRA